MKRILILALIGLVMFVYSGRSERKENSNIEFLPKGESSNNDCNCQFVEESLKKIKEVRVEMTRKDLLEVFSEQGGISTRTQRHYIYKKCPYIKVGVKFKPVGNEKDNLTESPDDKIVEISDPYLQYVVAD